MTREPARNEPPERASDDAREKLADGTRDARSITRRDALRTVGAAGAAALVPDTLVPSPSGAMRAPAPPATAGRSGAAPRLVNLTAAETEILSAMVDRLIPSDELGPGALESGALDYIDRALGEASSDNVDAYRAGLAALDRYARYSRGAAFIDLSPRDQDSVLIDLQTGAATGAGVGFQGSSGAFFNVVKGHTWQSMFGDPRYGGNRDFVGWDLIRYPGARLRITREEQEQLEAGDLDPVRRSAYEFGLFQSRDSG